MKRALAVVFEEDPGGGFTASVPALPGCVSEGETLDEARTNIREAIELYLEGEDLERLPRLVGIEQVVVEA